MPSNETSRRLRRLWDWARPCVLALAVLWLGRLGWREIVGLMRYQPPAIDFMPMWTAARAALRWPALVYDFFGLTRLQRPMLEHFHGLRPFVYPPTALAALLPLSILPFWTAFALWTAGGLAAVLAALWKRPTPERALTLAAMLLGPPSVLVLATGQITLYIAALVFAGLRLLERRPWLAGALLGVAAALKPQALVLAPVALCFIPAWRALAAAAIAGAAAGLLSIAVLGPRLWLAWLAAVPRFERFVMTVPQLKVGMITPTVLGEMLGLAGGELLTWRLAFLGLGAALMVYVFRVTRDPARRHAALLGGALFVTPYAMHYDAALLAPAAAWMLMSRPAPLAWLAALAAAAVLCLATRPHWGGAAVIGFVVLATLVPEPRARERSSGSAGAAPDLAAAAQEAG